MKLLRRRGTYSSIMYGGRLTDLNRTAAFAFVQAALLVSESVAVAMSAPLIAIDPWIPYLAASVWLLAGIAFTICFVTDTPKSKQPPQEDDISAITLAPASLKHRAEEIVRWARANLSVVLLLLSFFVVQLGRQIANILIQYVSIRFSWSISQVRRPADLRHSHG